MKFQDDISNMNTYIRTSRNQYVPTFSNGGIIKHCFDDSCKVDFSKCVASLKVKSEETESVL